MRAEQGNHCDVCYSALTVQQVWRGEAAEEMEVEETNGTQLSLASYTWNLACILLAKS